MPPYGRDAGLDERAAEELAEVVRTALPAVVTVEREGRFFVVTVDAATGRWTLRDEADWHWLRERSR